MATAIVKAGAAGMPVLESSDISDVQRLGALLAASGYFQDAREMAQAAVKVLAGRELGIPPIAAMMGISVIKGKVALGGNLIASRIRAHGYDYRHKQFDNKGCVLEFLGKPDATGKRELLGLSYFTEEDAKLAGVYSDMYRKYPRNMYFNRAISNGAKWYTPEVFAGSPVYVPEELGAQVDEHGDVVYEEPAATAAQQVAERKLAEMQNGKSYAEVSTPDPRSAAPVETADANIKARLAQFASIKARIGDEAYYRVLGNAGHTHANTIRSVNEARVVYRAMLEAEQNQKLHVTDADFPEVTIER